jgi:hypothetical protein
MSQDKSQFDFNDRYGIKPARQWVKYAIFFGAVGAAWLLWAGLHHANPELRTELISFSTDNPRAPEIRYSILRASGDREVLCTLAARDFEKNVVGQIEDRIPAGDISIERTISIPTRADAVNVGIERCRLLP